MLQGLCMLCCKLLVILQGIFNVILSFYTNEDLYSVFITYESICSIEDYACFYFLLQAMPWQFNQLPKLMRSSGRCSLWVNCN